MITHSESLFGNRCSGRTSAMLEAAIEAARERDVIVVGRTWDACDLLVERLRTICERDRVECEVSPAHRMSRLHGRSIVERGGDILFQSAGDEVPRGRRVHWRDVFVDHAVHEYSL